MASAAVDGLSRQTLRRSSISPRETLANLSITGHLRGLSDQPVAEIVHAASQLREVNKINYLQGR
jgi:hypothetical protein